MQKDLKPNGRYLYVLLIIVEDRHYQYISKDGNKLLAKAEEAQKAIGEGKSSGKLNGYCYVGLRAVDLDEKSFQVTEPNPIDKFLEGEEEEDSNVIDMTGLFEEKRKINAAKPPIGE